MQDYVIIIATLLIGTISAAIVALGRLVEIKDEHIGIIITRLVMLFYAVMSAYSLMKFIEMYSQSKV